MTTFYRCLSYGFAGMGVISAAFTLAFAVEGEAGWTAVQATNVAVCAVMVVQCRRFAEEEAA